MTGEKKRADYIENLMDTAGIIIALTSYNASGEKNDAFDFKSLHYAESVSTIHIRDVNNNWYTHGIPGLGSDLHEVIKALNEKIGKYQFVTVIGSSMGGYGALLYGALLNADKIISFSPQVTISCKDNSFIGDTRFKGEFARIEASLPPPPDVSNLILNSASRVLIYGSSVDEYDMYHINMIQTSSRVSKDIINSMDHWLTERMSGSGIMNKIIRSSLNKNIFVKISDEIQVLSQKYASISNAIKVLIDGDVMRTSFLGYVRSDFKDELHLGDTSIWLSARFMDNGGEDLHILNSNNILSQDNRVSWNETSPVPVGAGPYSVCLIMRPQFDFHKHCLVREKEVATGRMRPPPVNNQSIDVMGKMIGSESGFYYGPYQEVEAGRYIVSFKITCNEGRVVEYDICQDRGNKIIAKGWRRVKEGVSHFFCSFHLPNKTSDIEFRVSLKDGGILQEVKIIFDN